MNDADRYAMMSRPWTPAPVEEQPPRVPGTMRIQDFHNSRRPGGRL